jgi:hypothetical protein
MVDEKETRMAAVSRLAREHHLFDIFFDQLIKFKTKAAAEAPNYNSADLNAAILADRLPFLEMVSGLLGFINYILSNMEEGTHFLLLH